MVGPAWRVLNLYFIFTTLCRRILGLEQNERKKKKNSIIYWCSCGRNRSGNAVTSIEKANRAFAYLDKDKIASFINNVKRKTSYWSVFGEGKPAEPLKFIGPYFPLDGTLLKRELGKHLLAVKAGPLVCCKEYIE